MKILSLLLILFFAGAAQAEFVYLEGYVGQAAVSPSSLNSGISSEIWNSANAAPGKFSTLNYVAVGAGFQFFPFLFAGLRYEKFSKELPSGSAGSGKTIQDSFEYSAILLMLEVSSPQLAGFVLTGGVGIGQAYNYRFHEKYSGTNEDIIYADKPLVYRVRGEIAYMFLPVLGLSAELMYDTVNGNNLKSISDYQATHNSVAIKKGDKFSSEGSGANMSGLRYGIGLRFAF